MGGERGEPVDGEVVDPDDEGGKVDREDPEHEEEDAVSVVVEVDVCCVCVLLLC